MSAEVGSPSLGGIQLFEGLDPSVIQKLEIHCRWRKFKAGQEVMAFGKPSRNVFLIFSGAVDALNVTLAGREVAFARIHAGDCVGELAALDGGLRSASVVAVEDSVIGAMPTDQFRQSLQQNPEMAFRLLEHVSQMVREGDNRIMELSTMAAGDRVYAELLRLMKPDAAGQGLWVVHPMPSMREIGSRVGTTRETVARAIGQLYPAKLALRKGHSLYIMDRAKFESRIGYTKRRSS